MACARAECGGVSVGSAMAPLSPVRPGRGGMPPGEYPNSALACRGVALRFSPEPNRDRIPHESCLLFPRRFFWHAEGMVIAGHRKSIVFAIALGICLVTAAVFLNVSWVVLNWREGVLLLVGVIFFLVIIAGLVLNTIFLVREIRRNEQHDAFINAVTHELKTPVASIRLYLQTLQSREIDEVRRKEFYSVMLADSDRLLHTIEQVLRAGRAGRSRRLLHRSRLDLSEIVRDSVQLARRRYHLQPEVLEYREELTSAETGEPIRAMVLGDVDELKAAVSNLVDNAIKYSGQDVAVRVSLACEDGKTLVLKVRDRGMGLPADQLKQIFKRFYRIPGMTASGVKGSGLGLFIVRSVARRHGGRAYAESQGLGHGSTFVIELPLAPAAETGIREPGAESAAALSR